MRFHVVKGVNINLQADDLIAIRKQGEYYLGYVFTERPIKIFEKITIVVNLFFFLIKKFYYNFNRFYKLKRHLLVV